MTALILWCGADDGGLQSAAAARLVPQVVLALYDGTREAEPRDTRIHRYLELPLNHLGYRVRYHDTEAPSPTPSAGREMAAIVTWFDAPLADQEGYLEWLATSHQGRAIKQIAFGDLGVRLPPEGGRAAALLERIGVAPAGQRQVFGVRSVTLSRNEQLIGFETDFVIDRRRYASLEARVRARSLLRIAPNAQARDAAIDLAVIGQRGAYVHDSAALAFDQRLGMHLWVLDPFAFLEAVLGDRLRPIPDVTTARGRRVFFSTIGGDGWLARRPAQRFEEAPPIAGRLVLERFVAPFPDLPVTVAVVAGDLDSALGGADAQAGAAAAEALFKLPQTEIATSGWSLIQRWSSFASYNRADEMRRVEDLSASADGRTSGLLPAAVRLLGDAFAARGHSTFDRAPNAPRKYLRDPFDLDHETAGAVAAVAALAPAGRTVTTFLWSGDGRPFEAALATARRAAVAAIGGGGGIYDPASPSVSGLAPHSVPVGPELQVYDGLSGDAAYTNFWTGPDSGFHRLAQTRQMTEAPRRLKPFHLAFRARSAIDFGTQQAILAHLRFARSSEVAPMTASNFVRIVEGFARFEAHRLGPLRWRIANRGALETVRFDHAVDVSLDLDASEGVLGARRKGESLYVALDPAHERPIVGLVEVPGGVGIAGLEGAPALESARWSVSRLVRDACTTEFVAAGYGPGDMAWATAPGIQLTVTVETSGGTTSPAMILVENAASDADGRATFTLPESDGAPLRVTLRHCGA